MQKNDELIETGAWIGRQQAFAAVAKHSLAAQAACLRQMKESRAFEKVGLSWEQFCLKHAGLSRAHADDIISRHEEFGDGYFRVSEIARVSPATYRQIAAKVDGETIEIDGERLDLTPQNAPRIREAIKKLQESAKLPVTASIQIEEFKDRIASLSSDIQRCACRARSPQDLSAYRQLAESAEKEMHQVTRFVLHCKPPEL